MVVWRQCKFTGPLCIQKPLEVKGSPALGTRNWTHILCKRSKFSDLLSLHPSPFTEFLLTNTVPQVLLACNRVSCIYCCRENHHQIQGCNTVMTYCYSLYNLRTAKESTQVCLGWQALQNNCLQDIPFSVSCDQWDSPQKWLSFGGSWKKNSTEE